MDSTTSEHQTLESGEEIETLIELGERLIQSIFLGAPLEDVKTLVVDHETPLWYQDESGNSALHAAAYMRDKDLVVLLIENGAIWNASMSFVLYMIAIRL